MLTKNVFVSMCVAVDGLARVVEVAATFYLHGEQKEQKVQMACGSTWHPAADTHTCRRALKPQDHTINCLD